MIKVLIVDDLKPAREMIRDILALDPEITVVGMTENESETLQALRTQHPHLIILDSFLRQTNGYDIASKAMNIRPTPIIMLTASSEAPTDAFHRVFDCGILEIIPKAALYRWRTRPEVAKALIRKIKLLSKVRPESLMECGGEKRKRSDILIPEINRPIKEGNSRIVAIVSSTGGPNALFQILQELPSDLTIPVLIVQHMINGFIKGLAEWLTAKNHLQVHVAKDHDLMIPGQALLAPDDFHLTLTSNNRIKLLDMPPVGGHRPSGNYLFQSVADHYGPGALGIILTGMGSDGAIGMKFLKAAGGKTIAQDESTSVIFGMPKAAIDLGIIDRILPVTKIASEIIAFSGSENLESRGHQNG
jgi:two-component system chemotaxis response regulator CheB